MFDIEPGRYGFYVWTAYGLSTLVFLILIVSALRHAARWRKKAQDLGWSGK
jgi:heme exporter protein CcmD